MIKVRCGVRSCSSDEISSRCRIVITKPMDLTTLLKNVKNRMYKTKKSFARDLNLIWSNCLTYNSVEVSDQDRGLYSPSDGRSCRAIPCVNKLFS